MENQQPVKVYQLKDLIDMYSEGTLPEGEKIFKYEAYAGLHKWIHVDELKIQATFNAYYPQRQYIDGFRGIVNNHHQPPKQEEDNDKTV